MIDKELLELAAKAAGIEQHPDGGCEHLYFVNEAYTDWNPLMDDGDALRLAVKLEMSLHAPDKYDHTAVAQYIDVDNESENYVPIHVSEWDSPENNDPYAATRRAIVRAAAEIGKEKP